MGLHWIGPGAFGDVIDVVRACKPPLVLCVNELDKIVPAIKDASSQTIVVGRMRDDGTRFPQAIPITGTPALDYHIGRKRFLDLWTYFANVPADYFSVANEWLSQDNPTLLAAGCVAYQGAMDEAKKAGVKLVVGDFNTGQPQLERPEILDAMRPMLEQAQDDGALNIHLYPINGDLKADKARLVDRWKPVFEQYPRLKVVIGEYAPDVRGDGGELLMRTGDEVLKQWPQIVGVARFTRGTGWSEYWFDLATYQHYVGYPTA